MTHEAPLIATVAIGLVLAFIMGFSVSRLGLPPLVGYLLAGVALGPHTPGFVGDAALAGQLAEIGIMLLMFGVGLHFSLSDLMAVRRIAIPGALGQIALATLMGAILGRFWGWGWGSGLVLGLSLSVASTVVVLKALEERNAVSSANGRIAVGWLIVEDLAMVLALVLLPALAGALGGSVVRPTSIHVGSDHSIMTELLLTLLKVGSFTGIVLFLGPKVLPWVLHQVARTGSRELFTLCSLALALGIAFASAKLFGVSFALGAFFAGVVLSESHLSHKTATNVLPLQDAFGVLFFVSVGMLFDPTILLSSPFKVLAVVLLILIGKSLAALGIVMKLGLPISSALTVSAALAQIGEFSFILAGLGREYELLPQEGMSLILAGAILSITLNPLFFRWVDTILKRIQAHPEWNARYEQAFIGRLNHLQEQLDVAKREAEEREARQMPLGPQELVGLFPLLSGLTLEQRETILLHFHIRTAQPGERILRVGDPADAVFFIAQGQVEVDFQGRHTHLGPGEIFGEMALLNRQPRSANVTSLDYSMFLTLNQRDFAGFLKKYPEIRDQLVQKAAQRTALNQEPITE